MQQAALSSADLLTIKGQQSSLSDYPKTHVIISLVSHSAVSSATLKDKQKLKREEKFKVNGFKKIK